jgi:ParB-like chromosome segregation protein Spo0J
MRGSRRIPGAETAWVLVYGATRLAAAKLEGWSETHAQIIKGSDLDFEKAELAENLHRGELTKLDRDLQFDMWSSVAGSEFCAATAQKWGG